MKLIHHIVTVVLLSGALLAGIGCKDKSTKQSANAKTLQWQPFTSDEGRFTALLPTLPVHSVQVETNGELTAEFHQFVSEASPSLTFAVSFSDLPPQLELNDLTMGEVFDRGRDIAVKRVNGAVQSETPIALGEYKGREVCYTAFKDALIFHRMYLAERRVYQLIAVVRQGVGRHRDVEAFLTSLTIHKSAE